ncbi:MAG: hypothetical protein V3V12_00270 [Gammaproteobacteria bacterium]
MVDRRKDYVKRRVSVLNRGRERSDKDLYNDIDDEHHDEFEGMNRRSRRNGWSKLIPFAVLLFIGAMIAKQEIPAVNDWWERAVNPDIWVAKQTCQKAAVERSQRKEYMRLINSGKVRKTNEGFYIDQLIYGEMSEAGSEVTIGYSCYLDKKGNLTALNHLGEQVLPPRTSGHPYPTLDD